MFYDFSPTRPRHPSWLLLHTKPDFVLMNSHKVHFSVEDTFFSKNRIGCLIKTFFSLNHVSLLYLLCNPLSAGGAVCLSLALQRLAEETAAKHSRLAWSLLMKCLAFVLLWDNDKNTSYPIIAASFLICAPIKLTLTWKRSSHSHHYILVQERSSLLKQLSQLIEQNLLSCFYMSWTQLYKYTTVAGRNKVSQTV